MSDEDEQPKYMYSSVWAARYEDGGVSQSCQPIPEGQELRPPQDGYVLYETKVEDTFNDAVLLICIWRRADLQDEE